MALTDKLTAIADAIRAKTGDAAGMTLDGMVEAIASIEAGGGLPENMNAFLFTLTESYVSSAEGWELVIPHGLNAVPAFAVAMRTTPVQSAADLRGWFGDAGINAMQTNFVGGNTEKVPIQDTSAKWFFADNINLYCRSGSWGGNLRSGTTLFVGAVL